MKASQQNILRVSIYSIVLVLLATVLFSATTFAFGNDYFNDTGSDCDITACDASSNKASVSLAVGQTRFVQKTGVQVRAYFNSNSGVINIGRFNYCPTVSSDKDLLQSGDYYANHSWPSDRNITNYRVKGVDYKGRWYAAGSSAYCNDTKTITVNNLPEAPGISGKYYADIVVSHIDKRSGADGVMNYFTLQLGANGWKMAQIGENTYDGVDAQENGYAVTLEQNSGGQDNSDYTIKFGADCKVTSATTAYLRYYDMDNAGGGGAQLNGDITMVLQRGNGNYWNGTGWQSTFSNWTPPSKDNSAQAIRFNVDPGEIYKWRIRNVYRNNTIQLSTPYDGIYHDVKCQKANVVKTAFVNGQATSTTNRYYFKPGASGTTLTFVNKAQTKDLVNVGSDILTTTITPSGSITSNALLTGNARNTIGPSNRSLSPARTDVVPVGANSDTATLFVPFGTAEGTIICRYLSITNLGYAKEFGSGSACAEVGDAPKDFEPIASPVSYEKIDGNSFDYTGNIGNNGVSVTYDDILNKVPDLNYGIKNNTCRSATVSWQVYEDTGTEMNVPNTTGINFNNNTEPVSRVAYTSIYTGCVLTSVTVNRVTTNDNSSLPIASLTPNSITSNVIDKSIVRTGIVKSPPGPVKYTVQILSVSSGTFDVPVTGSVVAQEIPFVRVAGGDAYACQVNTADPFVGKFVTNSSLYPQVPVTLTNPWTGQPTTPFAPRNGSSAEYATIAETYNPGGHDAYFPLPGVTSATLPWLDKSGRIHTWQPGLVPNSTNEGTKGKLMAYGARELDTSGIRESDGGQITWLPPCVDTGDIVDGVEPEVAPGNTVNPSSLASGYYIGADGVDLTVGAVNTSQSIGTKKITIQSKKDLFIASDINTPSPNAYTADSNMPYLTLIAEGDIYISSSVSQLNAVIIGKGKVYTCALGFGSLPTPSEYSVIPTAGNSWRGCRKQLKVEGSLSASNTGNIVFMRSYGARNLLDGNAEESASLPNGPAETVTIPAYMNFASPYRESSASGGFRGQYDSLVNAPPFL